MSWAARGRYTLVLVSAIILQLGVFSDIRIGGVHPDITLLVAIVAGLVAGPRRGAVIGFWAGLLIDPVLTTTPFGMTALVWALVGLGAGLAEESINSHTSLGLSLFVLGGSAAGSLAYAVVGELFGAQTFASSNVGRIIGLISATNALLALPAIAIVEWAEEDRSNITH
ncbi:MAG: rod shape-determining protein MreD [Microthrixaceae bacterium]